MTTIAIINKTAPFSSSSGQESLDLVLAGGSFGQQISVFFIEDGVFQLLNGQDPQHIEQRNYSKTFAALEFYDVEDIYVCQNSLQQRGLSREDLCIEVTVLGKVAIHQKITEHQHCLSF